MIQRGQAGGGMFYFCTLVNALLGALHRVTGLNSGGARPGHAPAFHRPFIRIILAWYDPACGLAERRIIHHITMRHVQSFL